PLVNESSSSSKRIVSSGLTAGGLPCAPYARSGGTVSFHIAPGVMSCSASFTPSIAMPSGNSCGSPLRVDATSVPSACHSLKCTFTLSPQRGDSPAAPALRTQYLSPLLVVVTGSTSAGIAGGGRRGGGFLGPGTWGSASAQATTRIEPTITRAPGTCGAER